MSASNLARGQKENLSLWKRIVLGLVGCAMLASLLGSQGAPQAQASQPVGDVIFNYPYNPAGPSATLADYPYYKVDHNGDGSLPGEFQGYERAYTPEISAQYNGVATPDHLVLAGDKLLFYGHDMSAFMDYLFVPADMVTSSSGNSFVLAPDHMNFHTLSESGYLFNGEMTQEGTYTYYTGYALILSCANSAGMQENDPNAPNVASLRLYYIDHELWNAETFRPGNITNTRTLIATIKTGIQNLDTASYRVSTEVDPATHAFKVYVDGVMYANVTDPVGGASGPQGFGFYTGYYAHSCAILTRMSFEQITLNTYVIPPTPTSAEVDFIDQSTGMPIRVPETEKGSAPYQKYRIVQPRTIDYEGATYYLMSNSRTPNQGDIQLTYDADPANNVTTLYYSKASELTKQDPKKDARVNGGDWSNGATDTPVSVVAGDRIEYDITAYHASSGIAMLMPGSNGGGSTTNWFGQTSGAVIASGLPAGTALSGPLTKSQISQVIFENVSGLPYYDAATPGYSTIMCAQFLAQNPTWKGQPVLEVWDATDTGANNLDSAVSRVIAWVTADPSTPGRYLLYIGGNGGVYLSSTSLSSYCFYAFSSLTSCDFANLHTDLATNMSYLFAYCTALTSLDLRSFTTSNVTNMSYLFQGCTALTSLDLRSFDTSNVTNMYSMFYNCSKLTSLDLRSFNTPNVVNMSNMFTSCAKLTSLNLRSFTTSNVTDMSGMFSTCSALTGLNLSNFDTSKVTSMLSMFGTCPSLLSLNLSNFNTSNVNDMSYLFYSCTSLASLNLDSFTTSKVTDMGNMFYSCSSLLNLDLSNFDTSRVTRMPSMFAGCSSLLSLDLSNFDTLNVGDMSHLFDSCSKLTSLDLSNFNTSNVNDMSYLFNSCSKLTSLDLSTFDTSNVTSMYGMFSGCTELTTAGLVGINQFDVSKVSSFISLFQGCQALTSLDLSYWKIGTISGSTVQQMFSGCTGLSAIHLESASLDQLYMANTNTLFDSTLPPDATVYVGTTNVQNWILTSSTAFPPRTVVLGTIPSGAAPQPADWQPNLVAPSSPADWSSALVSPNNWLDNFTGTIGSTISFLDIGQTIITDTIPDGLTIDTSTITGVENATPATDAITWQIDGQTITWRVPSLMLPKTVAVTVTVNSGLADGTNFDNTAYVGADPTNTTYHRFKEGWRVTEQYFVYDNGPTTTPLDSDLITFVSPEATYTVQGPLDSLSGYTYYGYQRVGIDSDVTTGTPPDPAYDDGPAQIHGSDFGATNSETIKLYYQRKSVMVTINFVDQTGAVLKSPVAVAVPVNQDYYLLMSYFNSFSVGSSTYNYYDYMKNGDSTVADVAPPVTPPTRGATPVYPDASAPTFSASMMNADRNVTLCFTTDQAVVVHFLEDGNPSHVLHGDETYFVSGSFDPVTATRTDGASQVPLATDIVSIEPTSSTRTYSYTAHYVLNGGTTQNGFPSTVSPPADIILYFATRYTVTEKFHAAYDPETMPVALVLAPDLVHPDLAGGSVFNPLDDPTGVAMPPAQIRNYLYVGYKLTNDSNPLILGYPPVPLINGVWDDNTIIYVYDKAPGVDFSFTKQDVSGNPLEGVTFKLTPRNLEDTGWDSTEATTIASDTDGNVIFASLADKTSYLLEETRTLSGYALPSGYWILSVDTSTDPCFSFEAKGSPTAFAYDKDTDTYALTNYKVTRLPFSGSWGVITFVVAGVVLLGLAALALTSSRGKGRHANARHHR